MRSPELRQRFSNSRTASPAISRSNSFNSLSALEEGGHVVALDIDQGEAAAAEQAESSRYHNEQYDDLQDLEAPPSFEPFETTMESSLKFMAPIQRPSRVFVPDIDYKDYLYGESSRRKQTGILDACDGPTCAKGCAFFSGVAILFLLFIGILIDRQPMYIQGVRPKQYTDSQNGVSAAASLYGNEQRLPAASNAYATAGAYFITMLLCLACLHSPVSIVDYVQSQIRRRGYRDIPDHHSDNDSTIPVFHISDPEARRGPSPRAVELWNRVTRKASRWFKPAPKTKRR